MTPVKTFTVFGDPVSVVTSTASTGGKLSAITQTCQPGGGPPPHWHDNEDELFMVLDGQFDMFDGKDWKRLVKGESTFAKRGNTHTFRNSGDTVGTILAVTIPGGLDEYLEAISSIVMPQDAPRLFEISDGYGIHFTQNQTQPA